MVFGEVNSKATLNYEQLARQAIKEIGYDASEKGMDYKVATVIVAMDQQSNEIFGCLHDNDEKIEDTGAGDQGLMIGYATDETEEMMPLTHLYAQKLAQKITESRINGSIPWLRPDAKT